MNNKSFAENINEILNSTMTLADKAQTLVKMGVTPYEAMCLAEASMRHHMGAQPFTFTFGVEMETCDCNRAAFYREARANGLAVYDSYHYNHQDMNLFKLVPDGSLSGSNTAECVTPALDGDHNGYKALEACCNALTAIGAGVNRSCGLHVHIGAAELTEQEYCNVFYNYQQMETAIDSFMAPSRRGNSSQWCRTLADHDLSYCTTRNQVYHALDRDRYHKVNPCSYDRHKTIEFRQHQGSINYAKIRAWIEFLGKLVEWSKKNRLTHRVTSIDEIPFLNDGEKAYFKNRATALQSR